MSNDQLIAQSTLTISKHLQAGFLALLAKFDFAIACNNECALVHALLPKDLGYSIQPLTRRRAANPEASDEDVESANQLQVLKTSLKEECTSTESTVIEKEFRVHEEVKCQAEKFPKLKLVSSEEFDAVDLSSLHQVSSRRVLSLIGKDPIQNLYRIWLASFIPDGFWPQLVTRIISDGSISSVLSNFIPLEGNSCSLSCANFDVPSLWKLYQKGLVIQYEQKKLLELKEISNKIKHFDNELNLSKKYASQVELVIYTSQMEKLHINECQEIGLRKNAVRLASKLLVLIEQHILDIGEEWFPDTFSDTSNKDILSYVPCPLGLLQEDNCVSFSHNSTDYPFLCFNDFNVFCFSLRDILDAYATQSKCIVCPTHKKLFVKQIAPDLVSV